MDISRSLLLGLTAFAAIPVWAADKTGSEAAKTSERSSEQQAADRFANLDACIDAAQKQHPGLVIGWEEEHEDNRNEYQIDLLALDGYLWEARCDMNTAKLGSIERTAGWRDYEKHQTRAKIPEVHAREVVQSAYPGKISEMDYKMDWRGGAYFTYEVETVDGREAEVMVDASKGNIAKSKSSAKD